MISHNLGISPHATCRTTADDDAKIKTSKDDGARQRHAGFDNCKFVFVLLVVLWHTAHLDIMKDQWTNQQHGRGITHFVIRYVMWTEKVAVPGFCFLSGYFGKGFLKREAGNDPHPENDPLQQQINKEELRWHKTISKLFVAPFLWHALRLIIGGLVYRFAKGEWESWETYSPSMHIIENLHTWYLFALLIWRIWTYLFLSRLRRNPLLISMILAFISAHTNRKAPYELSKRVFYFFPYYVAGLYCDETTWQLILSFFRCRVHQSRSNSNEDTSKGSHASLDDRLSRYVGFCGILLTIVICQVVNNKDLAWKYHVRNWHVRDQSVFFLQYVLAGTALLSVVLFVKTIPFSLVRSWHENSTLAIYEWHWIAANFLAWGNMPFKGITIKAWTYNTTFIEFCFSHLSPLVATIVAHIACYGICVVLGNRHLWSSGLHHVCDPEWLTGWLFHGRDDKESRVHRSKDPLSNNLVSKTNRLKVKSVSSALGCLYFDEESQKDDASTASYTSSSSSNLDLLPRIHTLLSPTSSDTLLSPTSSDQMIPSRSTHRQILRTRSVDKDILESISQSLHR